ncbi:MAG: HIT domain-containing protein [Planctomycetes bacterium]|nr:HIT domain-containing protein [Planctomycetota bacterium]
MTLVERIVAREIPAEIVYEDEKVIAFLDIEPVNRGHTLICPKHPYSNFMDVPDNVMLNVLQAARCIYHALSEVYGPDGISFLQNNGAFNELNHYHMHIFPCLKKGGGRIRFNTIGKPEAETLKLDANAIRACVSQSS